MSFEYDGCFELAQPPTDLRALQQYLAKFGIAFEAASSRFGSDDAEPGYIFEDECEPADWGEFVADAQSPRAALNGTFKGGECQFTLGFLADPESQRRYALFEISNRDIDRLGDLLDDAQLDVLDFLAGLYRSLGATAFALGITHYAVVMKFVRGEPLEESEQEHIKTCIHVPAENERRFKASAQAKAFSSDGVALYSRWLPGLEARFETL